MIIENSGRSGGSPCSQAAPVAESILIARVHAKTAAWVHGDALRAPCTEAVAVVLICVAGGGPCPPVPPAGGLR